MPHRLPLLAVLCSGCAPADVPERAPSRGPQVSVALSGAWEIALQDEDEIALRDGASSHGVRVWLRPTPGRAPGVSPVHRGVTLHSEDGQTTWPLIAFAHPAHAPRRVEIVVQGPDLVVRAEGPPLSDVTSHPDAPDDPVLTWVRMRRRPEDWRIALTGLGTVSFPAAGLRVARDDADFVVTSSAGALRGGTDAPAVDSHADDARWSLDTTPSLEALAPYPLTAFTWTPISP